MNLPAAIREIVQRMLHSIIWIGVVTGTSGNKVTVRRRGMDSADVQDYPRLDSYSSPSVDDEVLVISIPSAGRRSLPIVVGKIIR